MFTPLHMGTNHMLGIDNYVPLMQQNFEVRIYNLDVINPTNNDQFEDFLTLSTDEVGEIEENQEDVTVHYGNGIIRFPNKVSYGDVTWTLNCYCEPNILEKLRAWRRLVFDPVTEKMGLPSQYMRQVFFIKYDGQGNPKDVIRCPGVWIKDLKNGGMNQSGDLVKVGVTLVISKAIYLKPSEF